AGVDQRRDRGVLGGGETGLAGRAERREPCVTQLELPRRTGEELGVAGHRTGPAALDVGDPEIVQVAGDGELVGHREGEPLLLGAVAQRGVVEVECGDGSCRHRCQTSRVSQPWRSGVRPYWMSVSSVRSARVTSPEPPSPTVQLPPRARSSPIGLMTAAVPAANI